MARLEIKKILILGSGPIQIGQAAEFDYSGTQALKALRAAGFDVVLVNSNPATIQTDPELAMRTYLEPLTPMFVERVIERERPDAVLPTLGGQTALNLAMNLHASGVLERYNTRLIGANAEAIHKGEDRQAFAEAMERIGLATARGRVISSLAEALDFVEEIGYPAIIRPSFTLGGTGGGIAADESELRRIVTQGLHDSPVKTVLLEESILGWKEFELEVMRDHNDTVVIITGIENFDPMGVHTGDSITVAPIQTLSDKEYQRLRDASLAIIREIGVDTGGSNIQFAVNPENGRIIVIEMNPRVSRSSALASKATGFPIAKIAALLAVGYHLDELQNDITRVTPAAFEPTIDYVVTKIPRFAFEKFPGTPERLGTQMRSVGEVMAIGRTFKESLQKAMRSLESDEDLSTLTLRELEELLLPRPKRLFALFELLRRSVSVKELHERTQIDIWFLHQLFEIVEAERELPMLGSIDRWKYETWREVKRLGFSDARIAALMGLTELEVRSSRKAAKAMPVYKTVDTCAAEFEAHTPYHYSTYEWEDEVRQTNKPKVVILGSGPNRIGQGVEFDYATVHAVWALREAGFETIMINSNPETVSTDYDTADRLYFEPLTFEDVMNIVEHEKPVGVIVQLGGQTPLKLARSLEAAGAPIIGTSPAAIHRAEDRHEFNALCAKLGLKQPRGAVAETASEAMRIAREISFPLIVRPSYVLGGRAMRVVRNASELETYLREVYTQVEGTSILLDEFLEGALELDVDVICDGSTVVVAGIMEHIERAGIHSGDSACVLPPVHISEDILSVVKDMVSRLALEIGVRGLMNAQFAILGTDVYVLEANPRASRTIPFVSKAIGHPLAKYAALIGVGKTLAELGFTEAPTPSFYSVKEVHLPFLKFPGVIPTLGPEMKSTGESMGIDKDPFLAYHRAQLGAGVRLPRTGKVLLIGDPAEFVEVEQLFKAAGFVAEFSARGDGVSELPDLLVDLTGSSLLRRALEEGIPYCTTREAAIWTAKGIAASREGQLEVASLQEWQKL